MSTAFTRTGLLRDRGNSTTPMRISRRFMASAPLWPTGTPVPGDAQIWGWLAAIGPKLCGSARRCATPGLGACPRSSWNISGAPMAERRGLFVEEGGFPAKERREREWAPGRPTLGA
jgi:low temperature requirement protein LtrA